MAREDVDEHVSHAGPGACKMLMLSTPTPVSRVPQVRNMDAVAKWFSPHIFGSKPRDQTRDSDGDGFGVSEDALEGDCGTCGRRGAYRARTLQRILYG